LKQEKILTARIKFSQLAKKKTRQEKIHEKNTSRKKIKA